MLSLDSVDHKVIFGQAIARRNEIQRWERRLSQLKQEKKQVRGSQKAQSSVESHLTMVLQPILHQLSQLQEEIKQLRQENQALWQHCHLQSPI